MTSRNRRILFVVGIVLFAACLFGVLGQYAVYQEHKDDVLAHPTGHSTGGGGAFAQALVAWNTSGRSEADAALNAMIFLTIGCAVGIALMVYSARGRGPAETSEKPGERGDGN